MHHRDHAPTHCHLRHGGPWVLIAIESLAVLEGYLSPRVLGMVIEWAQKHRSQLREDWEIPTSLQPLKGVTPLE